MEELIESILDYVRADYTDYAIMINGEFPGLGAQDKLMESTAFTIDYIMKTPVEKLFSFHVKTEVLQELGLYSRKICQRVMDKNFKSLEILENID